MIKGAMFDLDGTLSDTLEYWCEIIPNYVRQQGLEPDPTFNHRSIFSMTMPESAALVKEHYQLTPSVEEICSAWGEAAKHIYADVAPLKEGAADFLARLHEAGVPMVLVTNNFQPYADALLTRTGVRHYFKDLFCGFTLGLGKSEPTMMNMACECLGTDAASTWMFEDSLTPVQTANDAGYKTLAFVDTSHSSDEIEAMRQAATVLCENYADAHKWLDEVLK